MASGPGVGKLDQIYPARGIGLEFDRDIRLTKIMSYSFLRWLKGRRAWWNAVWLVWAWAASASEVPGPDGPVWAIQRIGDQVFVGGRFTQIGGVEARNIARWDGSAWHALADSTTNGVAGEVSAILEGPDGSVLVGGEFSAAGAVSCANLARWTGSEWKAGASLNGRVLALAWRGSVTKQFLMVGGAFTTLDNANAPYLAVLKRVADGEWTDLYHTYSVDGPVLAIRTQGVDAWIVGGFSRLNGVVAGLGRIFLGDFSLTPEPGVQGVGTALGQYQAESSLMHMGGGALRYALTEQGGGVLVLPMPERSPAITDQPGLIGEAFADSGDLATREVNAILGLGNQVLVAGRFRSAGGHLVSNLALWDGRGWSSSTMALGGGVDGTVRVLEHDGERVWVGGEFSRADHRPARNLVVIHFTGNSSVYEFPGVGPLPEEIPGPGPESRFRTVTGLNGQITGMAATETHVYAMGTFTETAGKKAVRGLGVWNGADWQNLGPLTFRIPGMEQEGYGMRIVTGHNRAYLGGVFTHIGQTPATNIAYYAGGRWYALGGGLWNGYAMSSADYTRYQVAAILPHESGVYAGGNFTTAGNMQDPARSLYNVARYSFADGKWHPLGGGVQGGLNNSAQVMSLAIWGGHLYVVGSMRNYVQEDGSQGVISHSLTRWNISEHRWEPVPLEGLPTFFDATMVFASKDHLYCGGTTLGLYRWDGTTWSLVLPRVPNVAQRFQAAAFYQEDLYVVTSSSVEGLRLRRWRSGMWMDLSSPPFGFPASPEGVLSIAVRGQELCFGGQFTQAGGLPLSNFGVYQLAARSYEEFLASNFPPGTPPEVSAPSADPDQDGLSNEAEFLAGTNPREGSVAFRTSGLMYSVPGAGSPGFFRPGGAVITFEAMPNRTYGVESREAAEGPWTAIARIEARPVQRMESVVDPRPGAPHRFYRVITPAN